MLFLLLGVGVFALDHRREGGAQGDRVIEVTGDQVEQLRARWTAQWGRPPTGPELQALTEGAVDEEILYREAQRLGLDRGDAIVRRRLAQKLTFMLEDAGDRAAPTADEVAEHYARNAERYRRPRRTTFDHVFLSADRRTDPAGDAATLLGGIGAGDDGWKHLGDPFMLARTYADRTDPEIAGLFGTGFADAVSALPAAAGTDPSRRRTACIWSGCATGDPPARHGSKSFAIGSSPTCAGSAGATTAGPRTGRCATTTRCGFRREAASHRRKTTAGATDKY